MVMTPKNYHSKMTLIPKNKTKSEKQQHTINRLTIEVERLEVKNEQLTAENTKLRECERQASKLVVVMQQLDEVNKKIEQIIKHS